MPIRLLLSGLIPAVLAAYCYAFFEWLFLTTQVGFMVSFAPFTKLSALAALPFAVLAAVIPAWLVLFAVDVVRARRTGAAPRIGSTSILPAAILACLALLLIDNFTYTVLGFGIVTAGPVVRILYVPVLLAIGVRATRAIAGVQRSWIAHGIPAWMIALPLVLTIASFGIAAVQYRAGGDEERFAAVPVDGSSSRPNVLLVTIDGVEARRTSAYGYSRATTPFLERLGARALVFENAFANAGRTTGSLTSLLTSKSAIATKVIFPPHILTERHAFEHLPGVLKRAGYRSFQYSVRYYADAADINMQGAIDEANGRDLAPLAGPVLRRFASERYFADRVYERISERLLYIFGIRPIVNHYRLVQLPTSIYGEQSDRERIDRTLEAIGRDRTPFFGHVHLMGTHCCGYRIRRRVFSRGKSSPREDVEDDAILQADGEVARLMGRLEEMGRLDDTLVIITSDHSLGWGTFQRLPLIIRLPGPDRHEVVKDNVELLDVAPTVLDVLGLAVPTWMEGTTLLARRAERNVIESVSEIEREGVAVDWERISRLTDPAPPLYGLSTVGSVVCDRWLRIDIRSGNVTTGAVDGHTAPCDSDMLPPVSVVGVQVMLDLQAKGIEVPIDAMRSLSKALRTAMWRQNVSNLDANDGRLRSGGPPGSE